MHLRKRGLDRKSYFRGELISHLKVTKGMCREATAHPSQVCDLVIHTVNTQMYAHKDNMCFLCREARHGSIFSPSSKVKLFKEDNLDVVTHLIMGKSV